MNPSEVHVLVVEDDEFTRMATIDILMSIGYRVTAVENGGDALTAMVSAPMGFDLVLCDVMLPVLTGIQLLECVAKEDNLAHIPIVMTSSNEEMDVVTSCLSKGAKDYLIKPIQYNTAKTLVRHVWLARQNHMEGLRLNTAATQSVWRDMEVLRTIGKGTHGTVVMARRKHDGAIVAVKRVPLSAASESSRKQADNEVILLKSLYHVNIVRFYDSFVLQNDELNIVMEFCDGGNLRQVAKLRTKANAGYFPEPLIMSWFAQLVLAVSYIHGKNVLHRDLKAQNVFLTRKHVVKLGDFGISKALAGDDTAMTSVGTPESMSPEICRGERYGKKSDIWSLGCVLYEMAMLARPFEAMTLAEMFNKICLGDYPPLPPFFSKELRLLIQLMLQQDPNKRPSIEDICRFPFVQAPIQAFLADHAVEFELALETEAKMNQPAIALSGVNPFLPPAPPQQPLAMPSPPPDSSLRDIALSSQIAAAFVRDYRENKANPLKPEREIYDMGLAAIKELVVSEALHIVSAQHPRALERTLEWTRGGPVEDALFRFQVDEVGQARNLRYIASPMDVSPMDVCLEARALAAELHSHAKFPHGIALHWSYPPPDVDYSGANLYRVFLKTIAKLQLVDLAKLTTKDRQTFFINIYNTMVLHGAIELGVPHTSDQYKAFEKEIVYRLGGLTFSLADIRHGILRSNRKPPSAFWGRQLENHDPRIAYCFRTRDPRSLLALLEFAAPLATPAEAVILRPGRTDTDLEQAMKAYCERHIVVETVPRTVRLPKLFSVYLEDFGSSESEMLGWLTQYMKDCPPDIMLYRIKYQHGILV
ncbi:NEK protein kinase [Saprolegnia parasitica CBS 223.65]|uniref:non-specific serine/threonine protein kinase n=1 Tax=Saprolegnia parasitica (strain CBS 223.65) TaxID=695850 RepID=A0A067BMS1_SAPPC|nr:NEK protein kinase [Saprolegnia parasitica CBS 223.65]KDO19759.1 NEK protein kinase [Saprolegnia parasitica CBS 223.65]|eukprot:XP_012209539.1 NEK protein kinase [Saprolegnia parasitica CBS 223.65]